MGAEMERFEFEVSWSCGFEADSPEDAALQGWAAIEDAVKMHGPTTVLHVRDSEGALVGRFDFAYDPPIDMSSDIR
jgi:hypothetical protein